MSEPEDVCPTHSILLVHLQVFFREEIQTPNRFIYLEKPVKRVAKLSLHLIVFPPFFLHFGWHELLHVTLVSAVFMFEWEGGVCVCVCVCVCVHERAREGDEGCRDTCMCGEGVRGVHCVHTVVYNYKVLSSYLLLSNSVPCPLHECTHDPKHHIFLNSLTHQIFHPQKYFWYSCQHVSMEMEIFQTS